jgi:hypothetical protein
MVSVPFFYMRREAGMFIMVLPRRSDRTQSPLL